MSQTLYSNTGLEIEYSITLIIVILVCYQLTKGNSQMNPVVVIIIGLIVAYVCMKLLKVVTPGINNLSTNLYLYTTYQIMNNFSNTGYYHVWPPILAVLVIFLVLLYNRQLGG